MASKEVLKFKNSKIGFLSNFPPRECGIATFTQDLITSLNKRVNPKVKSRVIALNEESSLYNYDNRVIMQMNKDDIEDYINIAKRLNHSDNIKIICIQHEFGLFGGEYGNYIIPFLETIKKPVVVTFHSVLPSPDKSRKKVVKFIGEKSAAIIVMAEKAVEILNKDYEVPKNKIYVVHHGIPDTALQSSESFKKKLRLENKIILSTFGLLSKGKGIEYMIRALPALVNKYPNIIYLVIGETHPSIRKNEGEEYRNRLIQLVKELGLENNVKFYNKYLELNEIIEYLLATDIYVCTNLDANQIVSGTLSYALGCGKAVVSTPSVYAKEVLDKERGVLVKFKNPKSFSDAIIKILSDNEFKNKLENNAYSFGRSMTWQNVALNYFSIFNKIVKLREEITEKYPKINFHHLKTLTNEFGCIQFSELSIPDKSSGYTVDDNSRALVVVSLHNNLFNSEESLGLAKIYLNFLEKSQDKKGIFKNVFKRIDEREDVYSEDAFGRAIWALGYTIDKINNIEITEKAKELFESSFDNINELNSPRAKAYAMNGLYYFYKKYGDEKVKLKINEFATSLVDLYKKECSENWQWFEKYLTYSNSKLPEALFLAYDITKNKEYLEIAEKTFEFLSKLMFIDNQLSPIGQNGWYNRNGKRAFFDQQPIDAASIVQTCLIAYSITQNQKYYNNAVLAFNWFLGKNHLKQMLYNETTGGCYDGLGKESVNLNQGAESTISYLMARLMLEEIKREEIEL